MVDIRAQIPAVRVRGITVGRSIDDLGGLNVPVSVVVTDPAPRTWNVAGVGFGYRVKPQPMAVPLNSDTEGLLHLPVTSQDGWINGASVVKDRPYTVTWTYADKSTETKRFLLPDIPARNLVITTWNITADLLTVNTATPHGLVEGQLFIVNLGSIAGEFLAHVVDADTVQAPWAQANQSGSSGGLSTIDPLDLDAIVEVEADDGSPVSIEVVTRINGLSGDVTLAVDGPGGAYVNPVRHQINPTTWDPRGTDPGPREWIGLLDRTDVPPDDQVDDDDSLEWPYTPGTP